MYEGRFALAFGEPDIDLLKARLTNERWDFWERFYEQDPWGELRQDGRMLSMWLHLINPHTEASMFYPYFGDDDVDDNVRYERGQAELAAIGTEEIQAALKRGREKHLAEKAKRG